MVGNDPRSTVDHRARRGDRHRHRGRREDDVAGRVGDRVLGRERPRLVDGDLERRGDVDLGAGLGVGRVGGDAGDDDRLGLELELAGRAQGDVRRPLGGRRDGEIGGDERGARLGEAERDPARPAQRLPRLERHRGLVEAGGDARRQARDAEVVGGGRGAGVLEVDRIGGGRLRQGDAAGGIRNSVKLLAASLLRSVSRVAMAWPSVVTAAWTSAAVVAAAMAAAAVFRAADGPRGTGRRRPGRRCWRDRP